MSEKRKKEARKYSRRNFLKGAGYIIGGAASLGIGGLVLTGCTASPSCQVSGGPNPTTGTSAQINTEYIGECVCPSCYTSVPHPRGVPCRTVSCPECGTFMGRGTI